MSTSAWVAVALNSFSAGGNTRTRLSMLTCGSTETSLNAVDRALMSRTRLRVSTPAIDGKRSS